MGFGVIITLMAALGALLLIGARATAWILVHPPRLTPGRALAMELPIDPREAGYEFHAVPAMDADGRTIELWHVIGGNPGGPCMVVAHGWGDSRIGVLSLLPVIGPICSSVVLYDLRGHGDSPHAICEWTEAEAADLAAIVPQIHCKRQTPKLVLMGISMGAAVVLRAAITLGEQVSAIVLDSPFIRPADAIAGMLRIHNLPGKTLAKLALFLLKRRRTSIANTDTTALALRIDCRALVIHGKEDRVIPYSDALRLWDQLPQDSLLWIAPQADHLQAASLWPKRYQQEIQTLLQPAKLE